jgi:hypothetical protein
MKIEYHLTYEISKKLINNNLNLIKIIISFCLCVGKYAAFAMNNIKHKNVISISVIEFLRRYLYARSSKCVRYDYYFYHAAFFFSSSYESTTRITIATVAFAVITIFFINVETSEGRGPFF